MISAHIANGNYVAMILAKPCDPVWFVPLPGRRTSTPSGP